MTLLVIGDLQGRNPQTLIEKEFNDIARPSTPLLAEPSPGKLDLAHPFYAIFEKEMPAVSIGVQMATPFRDHADNKAELAAGLPLTIACAMQNLRFAELAKQADAAFLSASISDTHENATGMGVRLEEGLELGIQCRADKWQAALTSAEHELRRAIEFGFEEKELAEARADVLRSLEESVSREKTRSSASWLGELLDACENRSVPTSAATRRELAKPLVEALDVAACQKALAKAWSEGRLVIGTGGPLDLGADGPKLLKDAYEKARAEKLEARAKTEDKPFAYASDPKKAGPIAARAHNEEFDFEDVTFANGVRLRVKKTDFKQKQILVSVQLGEGELSLEPGRKALSRVASGIVEACGFKEHSQDDLRRLNAGKEVGYSFAVGENQFSLDGATTQEDLLRELELLCAQIASPGWRSEGLTTFQKQIAVAFDGMKHQHNWALASKFMPALYSNDPRKAWVPQEALEAVTMPVVSAWVEGELANAPLDVALVGDLDVDAVVTAAAQTFGALPKRRAAEKHEERRKAIAIKTGMRESYEVDTTVPKTLVVISYPTTDGRDAALRRNLRFLGLVLNDRLRIDVREKLGAAYSPGAGSMANEVIEGDGMLMINAMADPDKVEALVDACKASAQKSPTRRSSACARRSSPRSATACARMATGCEPSRASTRVRRRSRSCARWAARSRTSRPRRSRRSPSATSPPNARASQSSPPSRSRRTERAAKRARRRRRTDRSARSRRVPRERLFAVLRRRGALSRVSRSPKVDAHASQRVQRKWTSVDSPTSSSLRRFETTARCNRTHAACTTSASARHTAPSTIMTRPCFASNSAEPNPSAARSMNAARATFSTPRRSLEPGITPSILCGPAPGRRSS